MPELNDVVKTLDDKFNQFKGQFKELGERLDDIESRTANDPKRPIQNDGTAAAAAANNDLSKRQAEAMVRYVRTGDIGEIQKRELSITGPDTGGVLVVPQLSQTIDKLLIDYNPIRANCTVVPNVSSNSFEKLVSVGGTQALRKKERDTRSETNTGDLEKVTINLYELSAYPSVTNELISSSGFDVMSWLGTEVSEAFATTENDEFINGTGDTDGEAQGILTYTQSTDDDASRTFGQLQYMNSEVSGDFTADNLISLIYMLRQPYRMNAQWFMSTEAIELARKLKDSSGRYLWADPLSAGQSPTLVGYPVVEVAALPGVSADAVPVLFGDMRKAYYVVDNPRHRMMVVDRITKPGWTKVFTTTMSGGGLVDSNALKLLKLSVTP